jgi:type I restriction enzyme S subunit
MSFPRYPKYKDSGVDWLGEVPEHWRVAAIKRFSDTITDGAHISPETECGVYHFVSTKDLVDESIDFEKCLRTSESSFEYMVKTGCRPLVGDVLFSKDGTIGRTVVVREDREFAVASSLIIIRPKQSDLDPYFLNRLCHSELVAGQVESFVKGAGLPRLSIQNLLKVIGYFPPLTEQTHIAMFLDRETAKIDGLVEEQRRLMELLKEKRQAVISHAVTKGLNPDAPMKPSGIDWLGDVPEHWEMLVIKRFSTLQRGYDLTDAERTEGPYPVITSGGASGTHGSFMACGPGVVTGRYGSTGRLFYIEENFWPHNTSLYVRDFHGNYPRFVWYSLQTVDFASHSAKAAVPGIDRNDIHVLPVAVPPKDEQPAIVSFLDLETAKLDTLTAEAQHAIDLLLERRTALISAAVTGQIDVRQHNGGQPT